MTELLFTNDVAPALDRIAAATGARQTFLLADTNTRTHVLPRLQACSETAARATVITTPGGEKHKNLDAAAAIWTELGRSDATRNSLMVNIGGGIVTDLGGFVASTFRRGMPFVNIPTTLLAAADASVGGKTGINFNLLKNEIGLFATPEAVIVSTVFFDTLPAHEMLAGYAEMLKHGLLSSTDHFNRLLAYQITDHTDNTLLPLLRDNVAVKERYVNADPLDNGTRHALNLGHTFAHAFESLAMRRNTHLSHGYAVAFGIVAALVLSHMKTGFPSDTLHRYAAFVRENYGTFGFTCHDYPALLAAMARDKKNDTTQVINFTLLADVGIPLVNQPAPAADITAALDICRDLID